MTVPFTNGVRKGTSYEQSDDERILLREINFANRSFAQDAILKEDGIWN